MLWIKAWHVIFMVTWFAGLFCLPRLFVYHASATYSAGMMHAKLALPSFLLIGIVLLVIAKPF